METFQSLKFKIQLYAKPCPCARTEELLGEGDKVEGIVFSVQNILSPGCNAELAKICSNMRAKQRIERLALQILIIPVNLAYTA